MLHVFQYWLLLTCCCLILAVSIPNIGPNTDGNSSRNVSQNWTQTSTGISKWVSLPVSLPSFSSSLLCVFLHFTMYSTIHLLHRLRIFRHYKAFTDPIQQTNFWAYKTMLFECYSSMLIKFDMNSKALN